MDFARVSINHLVKVVRRRIDIFKKKGVNDIYEYNSKFPSEALFELLAVIDEFSAITDTDNQLKASELAEKGVTDKIEYLAKMARSVGVHLLLANQTARKEKVPGRITANISGRISLGVAERIESDIALPDANIQANLIDQPGEFYSLMNGIRHPEHGNSPYLPKATMYALADCYQRASTIIHINYGFVYRIRVNIFFGRKLSKDLINGQIIFNIKIHSGWNDN